MTSEEQDRPIRSEAEQRNGPERRRSEATISFPDRRTGRDRRGPSISEQVYKEGEVILQEGALGHRAYIIISGMAEVSVQAGADTHVLAVLGPGEIFGEMGLIEDRPRSATVKAVERTSVKIIDREAFTNLCGRNPKMLMPIIKALFERLRIANARLSELTTKPTSAPKAETSCVITIEGASAQARDALGGGPVEITQFPFRVGRYSEYAEEDVFGHNDLMMEDEMPYQVSRNHFAIDWIEDGISIVDRGSRLGTIVNKKRIGGEEGMHMARLKEGENRVIVGTLKSPFRFIVTMSRGS